MNNKFLKSEIENAVKSAKKFDTDSVIAAIRNCIECYDYVDDFSTAVVLDHQYTLDGDVLDSSWLTTVFVTINDNNIDVRYE